MYDRLRFMLLGCIAALLGMAADHCTGANPPKPVPKREMRETATVAADTNVLKRFGTIEEYVLEKRWAEAIDVLQEIAQTEGRKLVLAQRGSAGETSVYLNIATRCNVLLSKFPPEGLQVYRKRVDPQARRWLDHWKQSRDEADLQRIIREGFLSSVGDEALWELGEAAWDRADFSLARLYWTQLVPLGQQADSLNTPTLLRYPDSELNQAEILSRLVLCSIMEGDRVRTAAEIDRFKQLYPDATGTLAGRTGNLVELLTQTLQESSKWASPTHADDVSTFALNPARNGQVSAAIEIGAVKWSHPLPSSQVGLPSPNATPNRGPLSYHPVTFGDIVLVNNARSIWALNLLTGEPAWPSERGTAEIYPPAPEERTGVPNLPCSGVPFHSMTIADGRLYARMGSSVTNPASDTTNATTEIENETFESDLVCLDLAEGQGKLVWKLEAQSVLKDWRFEGAPLVMGGRAYIAVSRRRPQFEFAIACFEASTGTLLWNRPLIMARGNVEATQNRVSHVLLTAGAGRLYLSSDAGAIIAVNARDGRDEWAVTYESLGALRPTVNPLSFGLNPPMFHDGLVFVAPQDSNSILCIEADSGRVRWKIGNSDPVRWRHLLGVIRGGAEGHLILSGASLSCIDIATGKLVYGPRKAIRPPPAEQGFGRGLIAGDKILWPTREAIQVIDAATGTPLEIKHLNTPGSPQIGGNLAIAGGLLVVAQPERLVAYCDYSLLKQKLERDLSQWISPDGNLIGAVETGGAASDCSPVESLYLRLSNLEVPQGDLELATATLRKGIDTLESASDSSVTRTLRTRQLELLRRAARQSLEDAHPELAVDQLTEARKLAATPVLTISVLMEIAQAEIARNRPVAAVEVLQQILDDSQLAQTSYLASTGAAAAKAEISRLIKLRGRVVYADIERRASQEIAALIDSHDLDGLRRALLQYPNSEASSLAWRQLALEERQAGRLGAALRIVARSVRLASTPESHVATLADWADTLDTAGDHRTARQAWKQLATTEFADVELDWSGKRLRSSELARQRLEKKEYSAYEPTQPGRPLHRAWERYLIIDPAVKQLPQMDEVANVLIPVEEPPAIALACLLIVRRDPSLGNLFLCECIDRSTGQVRWSRSFSEMPQWSAYSETGLLIAVGTLLHAVSIESGEEHWTVPVTASKDTTQMRLIHADGAMYRLPESSDRNATPVPTIQICVRDHWVVAFDPRIGLTVIDSRTGDVAWTFAPRGDNPVGSSRGKFPFWQWSCGLRQIALQAVKPATFWLIDLGPECVAVEQPGVNELWLQGPIVNENLIITMNAQRQIESRSQSSDGNRWRYQGGMSFSHVDPVMWQANGQLLLTIDGLTLSSLNLRDGTSEWTAGIAHLPLQYPERQVIASGDAVFAASHGLLRRISLKYGDCQWERFLGSTADQWQVAACGDLIAAWPLDAKGQRQSQGSFVVWCDARTGRILQRLNLSAGDEIQAVTSDEQGCMVKTRTEIIAYAGVAGLR